jgi:uncharacterized RDD family membrane protein YckC
MQSTENLNVDTPEQIALEFPLAGIGSRFLAIFIDSLLQIVFFLVVILIAAFTVSALADLWASLGSLSNFVGAIVFFLLPFCLYWGYYAFFEIIWRGQTPGKRVAGIRVIHQTGRPMTAVEAIGRNLMRGIDLLPTLYAIGLITMICNKENKRLGDFVAGTIVVHDKNIENVQTGWSNKENPLAAVPEITKLTSEELVLIETFLSRRYELEYNVRTTTAQQIAGLVQQKTGIEKGPEQSAEDFLEAVAKQLRDTASFR